MRWMLLRKTIESRFTRERWEMVITGLGYLDSLFDTPEAAQAKLTKIAAAYGEPESDYRIVEE